jgi:hypothetical protein
MSKSINVYDPVTGRFLTLSVKSFLRGALVGDDPTVAFVLSSEQGELLGHFEAEPTDAHILSEYLRQEAELASIVQEDNQK